MKILHTSDGGANVAINTTSEAIEAVRFHIGTLRQPLLALRFPNWVALARASLALSQRRIPHRCSAITETAAEFWAAHTDGGVHLYLDDPSSMPPEGGVELQPSDGEAAMVALRLLATHPIEGGALGAWRLPGGTVYRIAAVNGHAVAIRRASAGERARGIGFVHLFLFCAHANVVVSCPWPDDEQLEDELVQAEASIESQAPAKGDA